MVLTYFLNDFEMVPVAPIITGITLVFTFYISCIYYYYYYYYYLIYCMTDLELCIFLGMYTALICSNCVNSRHLFPLTLAHNQLHSVQPIMECTW
jgi:hypothetical protein